MLPQKYKKSRCPTTTNPTVEEAEAAVATAASDAKKEVDMVVMMTGVKEATAESVARKEADTVAVRTDAKTAMAESVVKKEVDMVEGRDVKNMVNDAMRVAEMAEVIEEMTTIVPVADTVEVVKVVLAVTRDVMSLPDMEIDPVADMADRQAMVETRTKSRGVRKLSAMMIDPVVVGIVVDTTTDQAGAMTPTMTVRQGVLEVATRDTEVTRAPKEAINHLAHPTAAAMVVQMSSLVLPSTLNLVLAAQVIRTSSAWLLAS
jgi:hypothetical protein